MSTITRHKGLLVLLGMACFVIVVAGLKESSDVVLPMMTALFLSLLCLPPLRRLERLGVPGPVAVALVVLGATLIVVIVVAVIGRSITQFQGQVPWYQARLNQLMTDALSWLNQQGVAFDSQELTRSFDTGAILDLVSNTATELLAALSNLVIIILTMVFMLMEARSLPGKLRAALNNPDADLSEFSAAVDRVHDYLAIKAWVSLATAVLIGLLCLATGVDFPLLWALVAFLFNFVPNIGSIIAAIPAVLLALVQFGFGRAALLAAGYFAINMIIGNLLEPRLLGRRLGLSTLVVFLSMLFWGWVWGPVGMLLSVPLTVVIKIVLEHTDDFRWIGIMLGPGLDDEPIPDDASRNKTP